MTATPFLWIIVGACLGFFGWALLAVGLDDETWALLLAWPVLAASSITVSIGTIAAGIQVSRR